jgi:hypothetical protein
MLDVEERRIDHDPVFTQPEVSKAFNKIVKNKMLAEHPVELSDFFDLFYGPPSISRTAHVFDHLH